MIQVSREKFRQIGLKKMPRVLIQPGGFYPLMGRNALAKVLKEQGYVSCTGIPAGYKGFGDPDIARSRYAMDWADFNLESMDLEREKTKIADTIACNRIAIGASHVRAAGKGKLEEYLLLHEKLLRWLAEKNIKVCNQSEASELLASTVIDRKANVLPDLACDLDGNGRPDGWFASSGVSFDKGTVVFGSKGRSLFVRSLCGLPGGKVRLMIDHEKLGKATVRIRFCNSLKKTCGSWTKSLQSASRKKQSFELTLPADCSALDLEILKNTPSTGKIHQLELRGI